MIGAADRPYPATMPLLCALGRHRAAGMARWNAGYYFSHCQRCGRDIVRTAFTRWQIPEGFRVVWQTGSAHASASVAAEARQPVRDAVPERQVEFPIRDVTDMFPADDVAADAEPVAQSVMADAQDEADARDEMPPWASMVDLPMHDMLRGTKFDRREELPVDDEPETEDHDSDFEVEPEPEPELASEAEAEPETVEEMEFHEPAMSPEVEELPPPAPPPPPSRRYPVVPDFMDDSANAIPWEVVAGRIVPRQGTSPGTEQETPRAGERGVLSQGWQDLVRAGSAGTGGRAWLDGKRKRKRARVVSNSVSRGRREQPRAEQAFDAGPSVFSRVMAHREPIAAATILGALVFAAAVVDSRNSPDREPETATPKVALAPPVPKLAPAPIRKPALFARGDELFVSAYLLNCRALPNSESPTVRTLSKGARVRVLDAQPGWTNVAHVDVKCWASERFISRTPPV